MRENLTSSSYGEELETGHNRTPRQFFTRQTKFDELKSKLQLQKFTGDTPLLVEQDFYATMSLANMALLKGEADEIIAKEQNGKELKYEYTTNINVLIGKLKVNLVALILEKSPRRRKNIYMEILDEVKRNRSPKRPKRSFKRTKGLRANRNGLVQMSAF